jgi:hypothetical protein
MNIKKFAGAVLSTLIVSPLALAQDMPQSGFMEDYSLLKPVEDGSADYRYTAPGALDKIAKYQAIMLDQPEIFIADDSPYKGAKPKHLDSLADAFRAGIAQGLSENYYVVDQPGDNVMYAGVAISNLHLEKKKRRLIGYTPVGLVGGAVVGAAQTDIASKANLQEAVMEFEVRDSVTGEVVVAVIDMRGAGEEDAATWEELEAAALAYGRLAACRLNNANFQPEARVNCLEELRKQRAE